ANIAGNKVRTSIFTQSSSFSSSFSCSKSISRTRTRTKNESRPVLDNLHRATHSLLRAARQQQRPDRVDRHPLPANDLADVLRIQPQFINRRPLALDRGDRHRVRVLHQPFNDILEKGLHKNLLKPPPSPCSPSSGNSRPYRSAARPC